MAESPIKSGDGPRALTLFPPLSETDQLQFQAELLDAVGQPMIVVDLSRTIIYWNGAAEAEFGWTAAEAVGRSFPDLIVRVETPDQSEQMFATLRRGESWSGDFDVTRRDGIVASVHVTNKPVFDANGRLRAVIGVTADASERRRLSAIVESSGDAILGVALDGLVSSWNGAAERLFGYEAKEIIGRRWTELVPDEPSVEHFAAPTRVRLNATPESMETVGRRKDGSSVDVRVTLSPTCDDEGKVVGVSAIAHDITERRDAQRALEVSRRQLADAQRIAHLGSVEVDLVNAAISRSAEYCRVLGIPEDQHASGSLFTGILDPDDRPSWVQAWKEVTEEGIRFDLVFRIARGDGEHRWVRARGVPEFGADGRVVKVIGTVLDETERIEAEIALRSSERLYGAFLDQMPVGVYIVEADGAPFYANRAAIDLTVAGLHPGTSAADLPAANIAYRAGTGEPYPADEKPIVRALAGRDSHNTDTEVHRPDGVVPLEVWAKPVHDEYGAVTHAISVFVDITERRQAQEKVKFQAHLLDVAGQAIIATDAAGVISYWNRAAEALYGWTAEEVHGRSIAVVTPSGTSHDQAEEILAAIQAGRSWSGEFVVKRRDGTEFPAFVTDTPITDDAGNVVGVIGVSSDVTDRHALEDRLRQGQRLESLGQLAGGVAHDFNNLLTVILNYGKFVADATDGQAREDAEEIIAAGEAAQRLTSKLLTFARREQVQWQAIDLNAVVLDVHGLLTRSIGEDIHLAVHPSEIPLITADRGHLEQILLNLAVNARDAMPDGGTLTIETSIAELDDAYLRLHPDAKPGVYVQLAVSDTGTGMAPDVVDRAFEPFFTTKEKHSGSGLGLATIHGIIADAGGAISLHSEPGLGTTVRVYFALANDTAGAQEPGDLVHKLRGHGESVLVVEDHPAVRALTARMLRRSGYHVVEADGPDGALALAADRRFDLLLTDVVMPEMSGRAVAEHIRVANPTQSVLYMSGYSDGVLGPSRTLDAGVALIQKPFTELELLQAVGDALL